MSGIEDLGNAALEELVKFVRALRIPDSTKSHEGDAYYVFADDVDETPHWLEIKNGKPNQVRPVAMLTLVFIDKGVWYVMPAPDVLGFACMLQRGHHGYDPIDSCQINVSKRLTRFQVTNPDDLAPRIEQAICDKAAAKAATDAILAPYVAAASALRRQLEVVRQAASVGLGSWSGSELEAIAKESKARAHKR